MNRYLTGQTRSERYDGGHMGFLTCAITGVLHPEDIPELEKEWKKIVDGLESAGYTDRSGSEEFGWKLECIERTIASPPSCRKPASAPAWP